MTSEPCHALVVVEIVGVSPWTKYNEYEGTVEILLGDRRLRCRVVLPSGQWDTVRTGSRVHAALWLERSENVGFVDAPPTLRPVAELEYEAIGRIERIDDEWIRLACGISLDVDLALTPALKEQMRLVVGAQLRVVGVLQLDLDPE